MKSGRLLGPERSADEIIRGTDRDPTLRRAAALSD
jgi:hypothetical protein